MALFESYERREKQILAKLAEYGINSIEEAAEVTKAAGLDVYKMIEGIQPICFENAKWAYTVGAAIAIKKGCRKASEAAAAIGEGLQSFCIPGSVADQRKLVLAMVTLVKCFWKRTPSASHSWLDMSPSQLLRVLSVSLKKQTKYVRNLCVLS